MNGESSRQIDKELFSTAVGIEDSNVRTAFLAKACGGDDKQFARIAGWLDAMGPAEAFFRSAAIARTEVGGEAAETLIGQTPPRKRLDDGAGRDGPGSRIGRYRLLERIGEGGCGVVYLAEQTEPVRRRVALKIIRLGLDTESIITRFEMERQTLALMDHPNIAHVLDAGATESGRPYFVMELVHGVKITEHCDAHRLGLRQRLELFLQVCSAIQHAHQKGIIHRDIKPSNVLISMQDGLVAPKVIDFGVARAIEGRLADNTYITFQDQFIGTPAYMSPEQAAGGQDLDTRGDGYSLGVLLYELLVGRAPFDGKRLAQVGLFEMMRILREEEPLTPSAMLAALESAELASVAAAHATEPGHHIASVRGDLDWIVIKAMAKDRQNRYDTVNGLAMDIRRYLEDEPILARPPARFYTFCKLVRRNTIAFAASVAVILALIVGTGVSSWFYLREREARNVQVHLREVAEAAHANEARLLKQSKARESVSLAAMLLVEGKIEQADALLRETPLSSIEPSLESANVFRSLGDWNAIRQRWTQAAESYSFFLQANRINRVQKSDLLYLIAVGSTMMEAGNLDGYRQFRAEAITQEIPPDIINSAILLKACLLSPLDSSLLSRLHSIADQNATVLAGYPRTIDAYQGAFTAMGLGLFEFRRGNYSKALEWSRKCLDFPDSNQARSATAHAVAAMAAKRLGKIDLARSELGLAREIFTGPFSRDVYYPRGMGQGHWQDWAIARVLLREAEGLGI